MESIYKWVEPSPVRPERPPLYHSKHDPNYPIVGSTMVKPSYSTTSYASLGTDKLKETVKPDLFLKKGSGALLAKTLPSAFARTGDGTSPVVERQPRVAIKDMMSGTQGGGGERAPRDFVTENAIAAILAAPRAKGKPEEKNWLAAPGFAKRPAYLERIKAQLAAEREYVLELADAQLKSSARSHGGAMREMGDEERAELLGQLKAKWSEVNARYSVFAHKKISTTNSSVGEIRMKENCERLMDKLEKDINRLSIPAPIFVKED